jgi:hypothetical protein
MDAAAEDRSAQRRAELGVETLRGSVLCQQCEEDLQELALLLAGVDDCPVNRSD